MLTNINHTLVKKWGVVIAIIVLLVVLWVGFKNYRVDKLAREYQDISESSQGQKQDQELAQGQEVINVGSESTVVNTGPYSNSGPNEEDDSFFIPGRVESLLSLVDPEKSATVVWISAPWCEICHAMRQFVWKSINKYADKVAIKEISFSPNGHIIRDNQVFGTPVFFVIDKTGEIKFRFSGATQSTFEKHLETASKF